MSDTVVDVPVDVPTTSAPLPAQSVQNDAPQAPAPVKEAPVAKDPASEKPVEKLSLRETIAKAAEKSAADAAEKVKTQEAKERAADGKFTPKPPDPKVAAPAATGETVKPAETVLPEKQSKYEPPSRFHDVAKAEWSKAPEAVQAEVARVLKENEDGITKYKASHERYEQLKSYDEIAKKNGQDLTESLRKVVEMENTFARNPIEGFKAVASHFGYNPEQVAAHILGQDPNKQVAEVHTQLKAAQDEIKQLKAQIEAPSQVSNFAKEFDATHGEGTFEKIAPDIAELIESGVVSDLKAAATMANMMYRRSNVASDANQSQPLIPAQPVSAQTTAAAPVQPNPAGQKSVTGAPGFGTKTPSAKTGERTSIKDAILRAAARA